jgi:hypothetical protein
MLSEVPCTNDPLVDTLPELVHLRFLQIRVSNTNEVEDLMIHYRAGIVALAAVKLPSSTRYYNSFSSLLEVIISSD